MQEFMRCVGIYPVGTLVLLESGRLGGSRTKRAC